MRAFARTCWFGSVLTLLGAAAALADGPTEPNQKALLEGLDKVTARVQQLEVSLGQPTRFGTLEITLQACFTSPPNETPEAAAFLQIDDLDLNRKDRIFSGWMFASSPSLHALEHPVYDVWLTGCADPSTAPGAEAPPVTPQG